jgi:hypothetical protein
MTHRLISTRTKRATTRKWSWKRDKKPLYERRNSHKVYGGLMTGTTANPGRTTFVEWLNDALDELTTTRKWSRRRSITESGVPRGTVYRWLKGAQPDRDLLLQFCETLKLDLAEPFGYFGWDPAGPSTSPERDTEPLVPDPRELKLRAVLRDPDLLPDERAKYEAVLDMVIADAEAALERRRNGDTEPDT